MKTLKTILIAACSFVAVAATAQTADDVINKHIAAMGGAAKISELKTVKMEGNLNTQGVDVALTITKKHQTGLRLDLEIMGTSNYQVANTTKGWKFMPIMQQTEPQEMTPEEFKNAQSQFDVQGSLFNYKTKGYSVEYAGTEKVDGKDAHKLKMLKNGNTVYYFIDASTNFLVKSATMMKSDDGEKEMVNNYADFKQNADGFWFPYSNTNQQGTITFDKISTNIPVEDKIFSN